MKKALAILSLVLCLVLCASVALAAGDTLIVAKRVVLALL